MTGPAFKNLLQKGNQKGGFLEMLEQRFRAQ